MLLPDNVIPEYSLYYNGYLILNELKNLDNQYLFNLYFKVKNVNNMSFSTFILCLDWLYLMEMAEINEKGAIKLCS